jgi:hypothetical protein
MDRDEVSNRDDVAAVILVLDRTVDQVVEHHWYRRVIE